MILEAKNKRPFIHFGFNQVEKTIYEGEACTIWQDEIIVNKLRGLDLIRINNNQFITQQLNAGTYTFKVQNGTIYSNEIILNVI